MEASEGEKKRPPEGGDKSTKRKMKTASQLELLEKTYAVETYPSEALRAELSVKLGLTDRQLQMWFCHRRLKDRKAPPTKRPRKDSSGQIGTSPVGPNDTTMGEVGSGSGSPHFSQGETRKLVVRSSAVPVPRIGGEMPVMKRYYESPQSISELRAIAFVESQLGEPLREDGPILGVEFDPLPPDAFGAPIAPITVPPKQPGRLYDSKVYERQSSSLLPNMEHSYLPSSSGTRRKPPIGNVHVVHPQPGARALHEYQFLPEQPSVRSDTYERVASSHYYDSLIETSGARATAVTTGGSFPHGNDQLASSYAYPGQPPNINLLTQGRQGHMFSSGSTEYDTVQHRTSFPNIGTDAQFAAHTIGLENPFMSSDRRLLHEEDPRLERKRKNEEAKIQKEVEAHEKRIRKELEKQEALRRKREEQMRKEMERHDRERRKEEERLMREKQREEERFQREQKRENERREKFLQKESQRAEKMKLKEEQRREKEAARLKAANERATARRIARESMELIEDERLELMELAASTKGLPSMLSLDSETLQNLELFRDKLSRFPPKSLQLKKPFEIPPWTDSEENIGNLLMVWRFLITFADVLQLWPFTLDEFVQAFHDYDPRLLGEVHIALLKSIIKDIEDVARTPSVTLGANQNSAANPGGGHPQIVEGAYAWGFDIRSWQRHLSPSTWPEILRQFALSAGFGPQLKKRSVERVYFRDDNEGHDGKDIISTLRNGAAAENAVALMQERGYTHNRRSRHRLTPGTVKFAAFHVLSLEGDRGLTILEVADKIQKSGLRDLTTSKTPEASIAAALSRDSLLFERTAPSTYCVRPAFRKDPADAEAILAAAREKIQIFQNGLSDSEEAEKEQSPDDAEREEDSECEGAEDPEVDDMQLVADPNVENRSKTEVSSPNMKAEGGSPITPLVASNNDENISSAINGQSVNCIADSHEAGNLDPDDPEIDESNLGEPWVQGLMEGEYSDLTVEERLTALVALIGVAIEGNSIRMVLEERLEAANALKKQMWAEAQLDKRRMKEEFVTKAQYPPFNGAKSEPSMTNAAAEGGGQSPTVGVENMGNEASLASTIKQDSVLDQFHVQNYNNMHGQEFTMGSDSLQVQQYGYAAAEKSRAQLKSYIGHKAEEMYVYRSLPLGQDRRRNRYWLFVTSSKNDPGSGRIFFESQEGFWRLIDSEEAFDALMTSLDTRGIRESHLHSMLQRIETSFKDTVSRKFSSSPMELSGTPIKTEATETSSPDTLGNDSPSSTLCALTLDAIEKSKSFKIELGRNVREKSGALKRYQDLHKWLWKECFNISVLCALKYGKKRCTELLITCESCHDIYISDDQHCPSCHVTSRRSDLELSFSEHVAQCEKKRNVGSDSKVYIGSKASLPARLRILKAQLALIEVSIPTEALQPYWEDAYRKTWGLKLNSASTVDAIFQLVTQLEGAIKRDYLSSNFETTRELLSSSIRAFGGDDSFSPGSAPVLPWVPSTTAAVALRLMELDSSISYMLLQKAETHGDQDAGEFFKLPSSRYAVVKNVQELEQTVTPNQVHYQHVDNWMDLGSRRSGSGRGRGGGRGRGRGRSRGGRSRSSRIYSGDKLALGRRGRSRGRGRRRGRRTVRRRPRSENKVVKKEIALGKFIDVAGPSKQNDEVESLRSSGGEEWEETGRMYVEEAGDNDNCGEMSESDENGQASGDDDYDDDDRVPDDYASGYGAAVYNGNQPEGAIDDSEEDVDGDGDEEAEEDGDGDAEVDGDGDEEIYGDEGDEDEGDGDDGDEDGIDVDEDGDDHGFGEGQVNGDEDESLSSEYSD
ncbi:homeobox-DDT domain protein RLT2-like [Aristolochia californica]|uniref:homeobox-DDT domain protein RLT2-like n=1 Tax=Aristolochia californica TaxID=171875 RepID=UPI0035DC41E5